MAAYEPLLVWGWTDDAAIRRTFTTMQQMIRGGAQGRGIVFSIHEERGSGGAPRADVELGRHCCARTSGVVSDFTSDTAISPMSAAILAGRWASHLDVRAAP
jgi:hypothetical protein